MEYGGYNYIIPRLEFEFDKFYYLRTDFVKKQNPKNEKELKRALKFAKLYVNRELLNCQYNSSINNIINNML
jgi:hypothetical protein